MLSRNEEGARETLGAEVEIIEGDVVTDRGKVIEALEGVKAIVLAISAVKLKLFRRMKAIERDAVLMILEEAERAGISRLVALSGYEIREDILEELDLPLAFGEIKLEIEAAIRNSNFNWTILGCPPPFELFFAFLR